MQALTFDKPYKVALSEKPIPRVSAPGEAVVKVIYSGLCGSDLHYYRGHIPSERGTTMGHEFVGTIHEKGLDVDFSDGDVVVATFTIQCGECWMCQHGLTGTCEKTNTFGKTGLDGGQAEYVLVPFANATLYKLELAPSEVAPTHCLLADIFVTGFFGVSKIVKANILDNEDTTILQMGAGPVGLCAVRIFKYFGFKHIVVVDGIDERLQHAKQLGAAETVNFMTEKDKLKTVSAKLTQSRGFDAVLEAVGLKPAMKTAFDNVRHGGFISAIGMGHDELPFNGLEAYVKGATISFGRCHVRAYFRDAMRVFGEIQSDFDDLIEATPKLSEGVDFYEKFERGQVKKVVFRT